MEKVFFLRVATQGIANYRSPRTANSPLPPAVQKECVHFKGLVLGLRLGTGHLQNGRGKGQVKYYPYKKGGGPEKLLDPWFSHFVLFTSP